MKGLVIKKNANLFDVACQEKIFSLKPRGVLKADGIFVGDYVEFDGEKKTIEKIYPRKNILIRPPLCNLDKLLIVIAPIPEPDLLLLDKLIICCIVKDVKPIIVINKVDIAGQEFIKNIRKIYKNIAKIIVVSAKEDKIKDLQKEIDGICAFAGQSAVGKSSLINCLMGSASAQVGDLSKKLSRGKQTTRIVSLYSLGKGYIADTAGFSALDINMLVSLSPQELSRYYPDFLPYIPECKYRSCLHTHKGDCGVISHVESGEISQIRYQNYLKILDNLLDNKKY